MIEQFMPRATRAIAASALVVGLAAAALPASAADRDGASEPVTAIRGTADANMERLAQSSEQLLVQRIEAAKTMIDTRRYADAREKLDAAEDTAGAIKTMLPFIVVADDIEALQNKIASGNTADVADDLLPIYLKLDDMALYAPSLSEDARLKLKQAERDIHRDKIADARKALDEARRFVTDSSVYVPVGPVYQQVAVARAALSGPQPNADAARNAVDRALSRLNAVAMLEHVAPKA